MPEDVTTTDGWKLLLEEMGALASELEDDGWETLAIPAGDTAAVVSDNHLTDRHGYVYIVPGNAADEFEELFVPDGFEVTEVYQQTTATHLFLLTVLFDEPTATALLLAGVLERGTLEECQQVARETGVMYSHLCKVDRTHLGSFEHADPEPFFPEQ